MSTNQSTFDIKFTDETYQELCDFFKKLDEKEKEEMEKDKRPYIVSLYDKTHFRRRKGNKVVLPKFREEGYSIEDFEYIKKGMLPPEKNKGLYTDDGFVVPVANSILYEYRYMNYLKKKRGYRKAYSMKNHNNKYDFKIYLDNHPKDTILTKNVSALLLAERIKWT